MDDSDKELLKKAKNGDVAAMNEVAFKYNIGWGDGFKKSYAEAFKWYKRAAELGDTHAIFELGRFYHLGYGVKGNIQNRKKALELYLLAEKNVAALSDRDKKELYTSIGNIYYDDCMYHGGNDHAKAVEYYEKCFTVDGWDMVARQRAAEFYTKGLGVEKNIIRAIYHSYYGSRIVTDNGAAADVKYMLYLFSQIDIDGEIADGSNSESLAPAAYYIGTWYALDDREQTDYAEAIKWFEIAAALGHIDAHVTLGINYENGKAIEQDIKHAVEHFTYAANKGNAEAQYRLARCYLDGMKSDGTESKTVDISARKNDIYADIPRAKQLLELASANGYSPAKELLDTLE